MTNKMIAKATIIKSALKYLVNMQIEEGSVGFAVDNDPDHDCCWDDILPWLEAQSCEDCISREDVLDYIAKLLSGYLYEEERERLEDFTVYIAEMPSVTPQRLRGKWIDVRVTKAIHYDGEPRVRCSRCGNEEEWSSNYCPNCGAEMDGGGEDEANN